MAILPPGIPGDPLGIARPVLFVILVIGILGTGVELLLLEHIDGAWQLTPLLLIVASLVALGWLARTRTTKSARAFGAIMVLFVAGGLAGLVLHYVGNVEFELEMYPSMGGLELFREAMMGATPSLAPGTMVQLGLLGLLYLFRYPLSDASDEATSAYTES